MVKISVYPIFKFMTKFVFSAILHSKNNVWTVQKWPAPHIGVVYKQEDYITYIFTCLFKTA